MGASGSGWGLQGLSERSSAISLQYPLAAAFVLLLACFSGKPPHIDDPLFLWAAKHALADPLRPYAMLVNWYGSPDTLAAVMQNPPFVAYWLAGAMRWLGDSPVILHLAMLVFPAGLALGVWELAARRCARPTLATALALAAPAVLVSSTSFMSDIPMLAFWVWGMAAWDRGEEGRGRAWFAAAGLLLSLGVLAKYYALAAAPLLLTYSLALNRRPRGELLFLILPLATLASYEFLSRQLYGTGGFSQAMHYSIAASQLSSLVERPLLAMMFLGGTVLPAAAFLPLLGPPPARRQWMIWVLALSLAATSFLLHTPKPAPWPWWAYVQGTTFAAAGLCLLVVALRQAWRERSADDLLLALAVLGPWAFAAGVNWCVNARALLPAAPFAGILLARTLDRRADGHTSQVAPGHALAAGLALCLAAGLAVAWADTSWAFSARTAARELARRQSPEEHPGIIFMGHWGFQYVMQQEGFTPFDLRNTFLEAGGRLIVPANNLDHTPPWSQFTTEELLTFPCCSFAALRTPAGFAGFYASTNGPLPYLLGPSAPEVYGILRARQAIQFE